MDRASFSVTPPADTAAEPRADAGTGASGHGGHHQLSCCQGQPRWRWPPCAEWWPPRPRRIFRDTDAVRAWPRRCPPAPHARTLTRGPGSWSGSGSRATSSSGTVRAATLSGHLRHGVLTRQTSLTQCV